MLVAKLAWAGPLAARTAAQPGQEQPRQNAVGEPIQAATDSNLSDIPNLERVDYDSFRETFGDVPEEHVPLINPDNEKVRVKQKNSGSEKTITTGDLEQR
ncbi:MAG: hypothetical protein ACKO7W_07295 [Elainella sp.]